MSEPLYGSGTVAALGGATVFGLFTGTDFGIVFGASAGIVYRRCAKSSWAVRLGCGSFPPLCSAINKASLR